MSQTLSETTSAQPPLKRQIRPASTEATLSKTLIQLVVIGLITQLIYITYIVAFPLISNTQAGGPAADLEILMRGYRWFAPIYTIGIFVLYYLFWRAMQLVTNFNPPPSHPLSYASPSPPPASAAVENPPLETSRSATIRRSHEQTLKLLILGFGIVFSFTLIWLYPITANDLFRYVLRGRIWAVHGESPMLTPPEAFPDDPYAAFAGEFGDWVSGYGPLWEILVQVPLRLGAVDMVPGSIGLKLIVVISYIIGAILLGWAIIPERGTSLTALMFFAWNPLILIQGPGNGHNDLVFMALMILGIVLWQRKLWWAATLALALSALAKATALLLIPLFAVVFLRSQKTWSQRIIKGIGAALIGLITFYLVYSVLGPVSDTLTGVTDMLTTRRGFAVASGVRMVLREVLPRGAEAAIPPESIWGVAALKAIPCNASESGSQLARLVNNVVPCNIGETLPRTTARNIFLLFYLWLMIQLWRNKLNLVTAGFLAYFAQLMLGRTFRIWYPMWLIPLAAIHLTPTTFWRTFLFSLTSELSIINYFVVWRWWLRYWPWEKVGFLTTLYYWPVMHLLTVPWLFGIPLIGPILIKWASRHKQPPDAVTVTQT
ncbi:MAG: hypothetical protein KDI02_06625 [Anaerolineae bacterium]|nr:hypothetical protein [Anaerolineae bacterium]MCB0223342.1 hypothetical protein [Anaerolineae bacterium]